MHEAATTDTKYCHKPEQATMFTKPRQQTPFITDGCLPHQDSLFKASNKGLYIGFMYTMIANKTHGFMGFQFLMVVCMPTVVNCVVRPRGLAGNYRRFLSPESGSVMLFRNTDSRHAVHTFNTAILW